MDARAKGRLSARGSRYTASMAPVTSTPVRQRYAYPGRALGMAAAWSIGALPAVTGIARCPWARFLHRACPGCGTTRALELLAHGDVAGSLAMHPLAVPMALVTAMVAAATVRAALVRGNPVDVLGDRFGRFAAALFVAANVALAALWIARACGALGGLPPVS